MDCNLPGSSVHRIFQARTLEWVAISSCRRSSWPRDWTQVSCIAGRFFTVWATGEDTWSFNCMLITLAFSGMYTCACLCVFIFIRRPATALDYVSLSFQVECLHKMETINFKCLSLQGGRPASSDQPQGSSWLRAGILQFLLSFSCLLPAPRSSRICLWFPAISSPGFLPRGTHRQWGGMIGEKQIAELAHSTAVLFFFPQVV